MRAMVLDEARRPLRAARVADPQPTPEQVLIAVHACAVCRTDLHIVDGELPSPKLPLIPGHEIVGTIVEVGSAVRGLARGTRVGVPWLGWTCGRCEACRAGRENLCRNARFTGYTLDGGFAELAVADHRYCFPLPEGYSDEHAAPLLCAGLIGYRSYRMAGDGERLGLYGFGAAAHILLQVARAQGRRVFAFTRAGDADAQRHALELGAVWAGASGQAPPEPLDAAILFAPVGALVPEALARVAPGGVVVCGGIFMSDVPAFPYSRLWEERCVRSVANLTRRDGEEFLAIAANTPLRTDVQSFPLEEANAALAALREGRVRGAAVLTMRG